MLRRDWLVANLLAALSEARPSSSSREIAQAIRSRPVSVCTHFDISIHFLKSAMMKTASKKGLRHTVEARTHSSCEFRMGERERHGTDGQGGWLHHASSIEEVWNMKYTLYTSRMHACGGGRVRASEINGGGAFELCTVLRIQKRWKLVCWLVGI